MVYENLLDLRELRDKPQTLQNSHIRGAHRLGEKLGPASIIYFGQDKIEEHGSTAMFICPKCTELFRCRTDLIISGNTKSCSCKQTTTDKSKD
jgi:uncharacterized C2H2 Zn-finger protein